VYVTFSLAACRSPRGFLSGRRGFPHSHHSIFFCFTRVQLQHVFVAPLSWLLVAKSATWGPLSPQGIFPCSLHARQAPFPFLRFKYFCKEPRLWRSFSPFTLCPTPLFRLPPAGVTLPRCADLLCTPVGHVTSVPRLVLCPILTQFCSPAPAVTV